MSHIVPAEPDFNAEPKRRRTPPWAIIAAIIIVIAGAVGIGAVVTSGDAGPATVTLTASELDELETKAAQADRLDTELAHANAERQRLDQLQADTAHARDGYRATLNRQTEEQRARTRERELASMAADRQVTAMINQIMSPARCVSNTDLVRALESAAAMANTAPTTLEATPGKAVSCMAPAELRFAIAERLANTGMFYIGVDSAQTFMKDGTAVPNVGGRPVPSWLFGQAGPILVHRCISDGYPALCATRTGR